MATTDDRTFERSLHLGEGVLMTDHASSELLGPVFQRRTERRRLLRACGLGLGALLAPAWPAAGRTAAAPVRYFSLLRRRPELTVEQFRSYWRDVHAPLVLRMPGVIRYVQHHVVAEPSHELGLDGVAELWWASEAAQKAVEGGPEHRAVQADHPNFRLMDDRQVGAVRIQATSIPRQE